MNKAFIFDMDGVIIDTERTWAMYEEEFHQRIFGQEIAAKLGNTVGVSLPSQYDLALKYGFSMDREAFYDAYHEMAKITYKESSITDGFEKLITQLIDWQCKIGLVSASPQNWIDLAFAKTPAGDHFDYVLSLHEQKSLQHKPHPDGYLEAMKYLHSSPGATIILEDSNFGIQAAKASGAFTIGFQGNLQDGYLQTGADVYAYTMAEVIAIASKRFYEK